MNVSSISTFKGNDLKRLRIFPLSHTLFPFLYYFMYFEMKNIASKTSEWILDISVHGSNLS